MKPSMFTRLFAAGTLAAASLFSVGAHAYTGLYVFGDSLSDAGNVALAIGADPGQVITGNSYIPGQPYASGQFSNGDVWLKSVAVSLGLPAAGVPSLTTVGTDFAFGGARVATDGPGLSPSLTLQANLFLAGSGGVVPAGGLFVVAGGGNDARDTLQAAAVSGTPFSVITADAASFANAVGNLVDQLQAAGAQNIIVWDVPNLALAPAVTALGAGAAFLGGQVSLAMNNALALRIAGEAGVQIFDIYGLQNAWIANPAAFGLVNVTDACGAVLGCDPSTYLFWDGIHPTSAGHALLASAMLAAAVPEPASGLLLAVGVIGLCVWRRRAG
jgi:phospholipase/lecithinase/hemolysin